VKVEFILTSDKRRCRECGRVFDMFNVVDADEWLFGHDCE